MEKIEQGNILNIALPKGRMGNKVYDMLEKIGYECPELKEDNRKLIFENAEKNIRYFLVKPSDVSIYVEKGAADIGVVGKDVLLETESDVYEILDLGFGKCKVAVAGPNDFCDSMNTVLRVATKYPNIAKKYYSERNRKIQLIKLNGSIEIAPCVNLSDVIVDIVETGKTLKENNMCVLEDICDSSARLVANKASYKFKNKIIDNIVEEIQKYSNDKN